MSTLAWQPDCQLDLLLIARSKFELVTKLKTAKALGLLIRDSLRLRAGEVSQ